MHKRHSRAYSFLLFLCATHKRTHSHTASNQQQCHAEMRGPHLVLKTTEISLRTHITTALLVCLPPPHPFSPFLSPLCLSPSRSNSCFLFFIVYHLSSSRLPPQFGSFSSAPFQPPRTDTHIHTRTQSHTSPSVYYLTPPGGRDSITELNSDPASTAWPEKRDVWCVCAVYLCSCVLERERWRERGEQLKWGQPKCVCVCVGLEVGLEGCACLKWHPWTLLSPLNSPVSGIFSTLHMFTFFSWTHFHNNAHWVCIHKLSDSTSY